MTPVVYREFPLADAAAAHALMETSRAHRQDHAEGGVAGAAPAGAGLPAGAVSLPWGRGQAGSAAISRAELRRQAASTSTISLSSSAVTSSAVDIA